MILLLLSAGLLFLTLPAPLAAVLVCLTASVRVQYRAETAVPLAPGGVS